ncbi:MAG: sensor histidine kinase [Saprospiraceae bacterium]
MSKIGIIAATLGYLGLLFGIAFAVDWNKNRRFKWLNSPVIYSLSLAVYCTAWTFFGSVGRAADAGAAFLPIYLGPVVLAPVWIIVLQKIVSISKHQRITSVADFISSRYGKSTFLGIVAVIVAVFGIIPYISIQLKAIATSLDLLTTANPFQSKHDPTLPFYADSAFYVAILLAAFSILFGTRHLDPNERHAGMVAAIAYESILKLLIFLAVGLFIVYELFDGFGDLFGQAIQLPAQASILTISDNIQGGQWFWLMLVSMFAFILLPRQFHVAVVENDNPANLKTASWLLPLYLLLINIFVIPIAVAGNLLLGSEGVSPDTYVLTLPLWAGKEGLAFLSALGGFSAATGMVIVATVSLSIMISNNFILPLVIRYELIDPSRAEMPERLLGIRRVSIVVVLLLSYSYFKSVGEGYSLVSIGLISFLAVAQFAPAVFGGIYWKRGNKSGAMAGLLVGFAVWCFTLPFPTLIEAGWFNKTILTDGLFGCGLLNPWALFGLEYSDHFSHAAFWSLSLNTFSYVLVSLYTTTDAIGLQQADVFVNIDKYQGGYDQTGIIKRQASIADIQKVMNRFLGAKQARKLLRLYEREHQINLSQQIEADAELIHFTETKLTGALGAASSKIIIASITKIDPISMEEMLQVLEQTREIIQYSKALERKSSELETLTVELRHANVRLQELDRLKAEFVSTVTHELRTPITSIKAFAKIIADNPQLDSQQKEEFLDIVVSESERVSRLINQVLDLEKIQASEPTNFVKIDLVQLVKEVTRTFKDQYLLSLSMPAEPILISCNKDRMTQVVVNLLANAFKFCDPEQGKIEIVIDTEGSHARLRVSNNGRAIHKDQETIVFDRFTQLQDPTLGKPTGSGLGLYISKHIVERHKGQIQLIFLPEWATSFLITLPLAD